ncbi:hypothetical protein, partial [Streptomyces sp. SID3343]|uniref:hypothetical protein n=1 Tax=Streptomyces sp. SID3343 TaxID=2690260 RepID=UPI001F4293DB
GNEHPHGRDDEHDRGGGRDHAANPASPPTDTPAAISAGNAQHAAQAIPTNQARPPAARSTPARRW